ncbi:MAG: DUF885 family protein, partial [Sinomonas sp.]|nr:DUF885 family protein [Sinomonas sp.]
MSEARDRLGPVTQNTSDTPTAPADRTSAPAAHRAPSMVDAAAEAYTDRLLELNPSLATELGFPGHETDYPDYSPAGHEARVAMIRDTLTLLSGLEPGDEIDEVTLDAMRERLGLEVEEYESGWALADLNNIDSPPQHIRAVFDLMPTDTAEHWRHISGRAANVPGAIESYIASLTAAAAGGKVAAARQVRAVVGQARKYGEDGAGFFAKLAAEAKLDGGAALPDDLAAALGDASSSAAYSYRRLADFLEGQLLPQAPE